MLSRSKVYCTFTRGRTGLEDYRRWNGTTSQIELTSHRPRLQAHFFPASRLRSSRARRRHGPLICRASHLFERPLCRVTVAAANNGQRGDVWTSVMARRRDVASLVVLGGYRGIGVQMLGRDAIGNLTAGGSNLRGWSHSLGARPGPSRRWVTTPHAGNPDPVSRLPAAACRQG